MLAEERKSSHTSFSELLRISVDTVLNTDQEIKATAPSYSHYFLGYLKLI